MAKFLTTVGNSHYIEQIILNAKENLTLVTPYLNISKNIIDRLTDADKENIKITLIYGKNKLIVSEQKKLEKLKNIKIYFCENLHAKCYLNEQSLIITSMNLYEFSERNNREMGIYIEKGNDNQIFTDTLKEIESIKNASVLIKSTAKVNESDLIYLSEDKNEITNFYYPSLYRVLKDKFKNHTVHYDEENRITIENYPINEIDLVINGRVDLKFENELFFNYLKENYQKKIDDSSRGIRFYWNYYCINIYPEKSFEVLVNIEGLKKIIDKNLQIIDNIKRHITVADDNFNRKFY